MKKTAKSAVVEPVETPKAEGEKAASPVAPAPKAAKATPVGGAARNTEVDDAPAKVTKPTTKPATKTVSKATEPAPSAETPQPEPVKADVPVAAPVKEAPVKEAKVPTGKNAPIPGAMVAPASPEARAAALALAESAPPRQPALLRPVGRSMPAAVPVRTAVKLVKAPAINSDDEFDGIDELSEGQFLFQQHALLTEQRNTLQGQAEAFQAEADQIAAEMEPGDVQFDDESGEGGTMSMERERDLAMSDQFLL